MLNIIKFGGNEKINQVLWEMFQIIDLIAKF